MNRTAATASRARRARKDLLIVGPLPPPMGGAPETLMEMIRELAKDPALRFSVIDTSPAGDVRKNAAGVDLERLYRMLVILTRYAWESPRARVVLVFANNLFASTMVPVFLAFARLLHTRFFIKPVGGDLGMYLAGKGPFVRRTLVRILCSADGILAQTRQLQDALSGLGCGKVLYLPGCRSQSVAPRARHLVPGELRLIFLAHIIAEKGPLVLFEALGKLPPDIRAKVHCDFYGPIHHSIRREFLSHLDKTPAARYCGEAPVGCGASLMTEYDALVLPTFFACEGHPGVIIEAMHAGVPVVSTRHRAIPELVTDGENGILVPVRDPDALAGALERLARDPALVRQMGQAHHRRGRDFSTDVVVGRMMRILFAKA